jgi:hypothetical protein
MVKKILVFMLCFVFMAASVPLYGEGAPKSFPDVSNSHWGRSAIDVMVAKGIFSGYPDGTFRPDGKVTRAEFAKVMVLSLELPFVKHISSSFVDLPNSHWAVPYIEVAKPYLTGYKASIGVAFKPDEPAQREDMAVALVQALKLPLVSEDLLKNYADYTTISPQLRPYVATAISNELMVGYESGGKKYFGPLEVLTRAQASQLLVNVLVKSEKIVLGDTKILLQPSEQSNRTAVVARVVPDGNFVWIKWENKDQQKDLKYYKVTASLVDENPSYPTNGYAAYFTSVNDFAFKLSAGTPYKGSEFSKFEAGKTYCMAITTVYQDGTMLTSKKVEVTIPSSSQSTETRKPAALKSYVESDGIKLLWTSNVNQSDLQYFKVVASLSDSTPEYPSNGYAGYITNVSESYMRLKPGHSYQGGDFSKFESGKTYYFSVTTVYKDGTKLTSNVITLKMP